MDEVKIGDIFYSSWGYDQTNIDFYQVIAKTEKMVTARRIGANRVLAEHGYYKTPLKDEFVSSTNFPDDPRYGRPFKCRIQVSTYDGKRYFKVGKYYTAYQWDGKPKWESEPR